MLLKLDSNSMLLMLMSYYHEVRPIRTNELAEIYTGSKVKDFVTAHMLAI